MFKFYLFLSRIKSVNLSNFKTRVEFIVITFSWFIAFEQTLRKCSTWLKNDNYTQQYQSQVAHYKSSRSDSGRIVKVN